MKIEMLKEQLKPEKKERGVWLSPLMELIESDNKTLKFNCVSVSEANRCKNSIDSHNKTKNLGLVTWRRNYTVFVIKA